MHTYRPHRLTPLFQRPSHRPAAPEPGATHDMLILSSRPDLTPGFPDALAHPSQRLPLTEPALRRNPK